MEFVSDESLARIKTRSKTGDGAGLTAYLAEASVNNNVLFKETQGQPCCSPIYKVVVVLGDSSIFS